ncbi:MAG: helix-turn-helix transcriptional regulator [Chroococcales cyanobacterium]
MMAYADKQFAEVAKVWDLEVLYQDLASVKGKRLTPVEKMHLRGLLSGYSPAEIAQKLEKSIKGVEVDLCNTLYPYVKNLVGRENSKVNNWRNICEWLAEAGYKKSFVSLAKSTFNLPAELALNKTQIRIENNQVIIELNIKITADISPQIAGQEPELIE